MTEVCLWVQSSWKLRRMKMRWAVLQDPATVWCQGCSQNLCLDEGNSFGWWSSACLQIMALPLAGWVTLGYSGIIHCLELWGLNERIGTKPLACCLAREPAWEIQRWLLPFVLLPPSPVVSCVFPPAVLRCLASSVIKLLALGPRWRHPVLLRI